MESQLRRGILDVCVLAAIKNEDSYGYKIIKDLKPLSTLSESTLYTILKRLEEGEMITTYTREYEGRQRKYYHISSLGRERIEQFKEDSKELINVYKFIVGESL